MVVKTYNGYKRDEYYFKGFILSKKVKKYLNFTMVSHIHNMIMNVLMNGNVNYQSIFMKDIIQLLMLKHLVERRGL